MWAKLRLFFGKIEKKIPIFLILKNISIRIKKLKIH